MEDKIREVLKNNGIGNNAETHDKLTKDILSLLNYNNKEIINYIENEMEIEIPIEELIHEDGGPIGKKEYGKILLKYLIKELKKYY